ncbi:MAG: HdaA/DnaA family protein [Planktomarina sp.]
MTEQLSFDLPVRAAHGREDFFVSSANAAAVALLDAPASWPQGKLLILGPKGCGKSHLIDIWCTAVGGVRWDLAANDLPRDGSAVAIDDVDAIAGDTDAETKLFHIHNHILATGGTLLMAAKTPPKDAGFALADLKSRLMGTMATVIEAPDDTLLQAVILKHFMDHQIAVPPQVQSYIATHCDRSFAAIAKTVRDLDDMSLRTGRKITRAMAAQILNAP